MVSPRKTVFISYAHKDDTENFVSRLGYSLAMYFDVFWDVKLQAGPWSEQLVKNIETCDAFLVVMSYTQKHESEWCKRELELAQTHNKQVLPIRKFNNYHDKDLEINQYADFTKDFDEGFKTLTYLITNQRLTSWEYLYHQNDNEILTKLGEGLIPTIISKEFAEWLIVYRLWPEVRALLKDEVVFIKRVFTVRDIPWAVAYMNDQDAYRLVNRTKKEWVDRTVLLANSYLNTGFLASDISHRQVGMNAGQIMVQIKQLIWEMMKSQRDFRDQKYLEDSYIFESASKLRELILLYARRSRHLY